MRSHLDSQPAIHPPTTTEEQPRVKVPAEGSLAVTANVTYATNPDNGWQAWKVLWARIFSPSNAWEKLVVMAQVLKESSDDQWASVVVKHASQQSRTMVTKQGKERGSAKRLFRRILTPLRPVLCVQCVCVARSARLCLRIFCPTAATQDS